MEHWGEGRSAPPFFLQKITPPVKT